MEQLCNESSNPLQTAAEKGHKDCLKVLIKGASVNAKSDVFLIATGNQQFECANIILDAGIDANYQRPGTRDTPFMCATVNDHSSLVRKLISDGANVNSVNSQGTAALHMSHNKECTDLLIREGAHVNLKDKHGLTPLRCAVQYRSVDCTLSLISAGADVNKVSYNRETPLIKAVSFGNIKQIETLLENDAYINVYDGNGRNALFRATLTDNIAIMKMLIRAGADVNLIHSTKKQYSLIVAALGGHLDCMSILLQAGADVNTAINCSLGRHTALTLTVLRHHYWCFKLLLQAGADVNFISNSGTALHVAAEEGFAFYIIPLISAGADVNALNSDNQSSLLLATYCNPIDCVKLLLQSGAEVNLILETKNRLFSPCYPLLGKKIKIEIITLLHAAGEKHVLEKELTWSLERRRLGLLISEADRKYIDKILEYQYKPTLCLMQISRRTIREHLLQMSRVNLFDRVPRLGFPSMLAEYLLYDVSREVKSDRRTD